MAKNIKFMTTKEKLSRFRNLTKGRLLKMKENIQENILFNLPDIQNRSLSFDEEAIIKRLKSELNDLLSTWDYRSNELLNKINSNL